MTNWLDRVSVALSPRWGLKRLRARVAVEIMKRHYEAAAIGRRTQGWNRSGGDANAAVGGDLSALRQHARDLVKNNPYASNALDSILDHTVGWGIVAKPKKEKISKAAYNVAVDRWTRWAETTACDADGRHDFYGLQKLVLRSTVEAGECLVRRRWRRPEDGLPIPLQLQVLEPDFLDTMRETVVNNGLNRVIQGVEFDAIGRRAAYWLFREHPGSTFATVGASERVRASEILHIGRAGRPGQVRFPSWFAPVILRMKDFDEYEDAALMKQKIAACLAVITSDLDGSAVSIGKTETETPDVDMLEPGMILNTAAGRQVTVVQPPSISEHAEYSKTVLRAIAAGLGIGYEDLCGDYADMPFSAARMSRLRLWARAEDWRWRMLIPQFCDPAWQWAMQAAVIDGLVEMPIAEWTAPPMPMLDPSAEGLAYARNIRAGITTLSESIRERGFDPDTMLAEMAADWKKVDALGLILDSDPRRTTQAGQPRDPKPQPGRAAIPDSAAEPANDNGRAHR